MFHVYSMKIKRKHVYQVKKVFILVSEIPTTTRNNSAGSSDWTVQIPFKQMQSINT